MHFDHTIGAQRHVFNDLKTLLAKASPSRSGDYLAGLAAASEGERMAARMALADVPLSVFLNEALVPYEDDEVTRLILDRHDAQAFQPIASLTVGNSATGCSCMRPTARHWQASRPASRRKWPPRSAS